MKIIPLFLCICLIVLTHMACDPNKNHSKPSEKTEEPKAQVTLTGDYAKIEKITYGSGGGFTGAWSGVEILKDGTVNFLESVAGSEKQRQVKLASAEVMPIFVAIQKANFLKIQHSKPENMTTTLAAEGEDIRHGVSYGDGAAPKSVEPIVQEVIAVTQEARAAKNKAEKGE